MAIPSQEFLVPDAPLRLPRRLGGAGEGAVVTFSGRVRGEENGRPIRGIEYAVYAAMAARVFGAIRAAAGREFGAHLARVRHRTGFVPTGDASIVIAVATPHSPAAFDICRYYLVRIKAEVPIWKHPVFS